MSYKSTFITISADCPDVLGSLPPELKTGRSKARIEYELLRDAPYSLDHDALNFTVYSLQRAQAGEVPDGREAYLSKGRPCMRASPLVKRYGWGAHYDAAGKIAIYRAGSGEYARLAKSQAGHNVIQGMRNKRA